MCLPFVKFQISTQNPQALWPAVDRQESLWFTGILLPRDFRGKTMEAVTGRAINNASRYRVTNKKFKFRNLEREKRSREKNFISIKDG